MTSRATQAPPPASATSPQSPSGSSVMSPMSPSILEPSELPLPHRSLEPVSEQSAAQQSQHELDPAAAATQATQVMAESELPDLPNQLDQVMPVPAVAVTVPAFNAAEAASDALTAACSRAKAVSEALCRGSGPDGAAAEAAAKVVAE